MRKLSAPLWPLIVAIALYFTLFWGYDALRMLTSPTYGLEDVWRSQFLFGIGRLFGLSPIGLIKLAAFFGTLKLAVAAICAIHHRRSLAQPCGRQAGDRKFWKGACPGRADHHRLGRSGILVAQHRSGARARDPTCVCRSCGRALHCRAQLSCATRISRTTRSSLAERRPGSRPGVRNPELD